MRRTKEEAEQTRISIIAHALRLFSEKGVTATSLVEVAASVGVTRGAVYWYFKNKWDLFDALLEHYGEPLDRLGQASVNESEPDPLGKMKEILRFIFYSTATSEDYRNLFSLCSHTFYARSQGCQDDQKTRDRLDQMLREKHQLRCRILQNAIRKGQLPANLDVEAASSLIRAMVEGIVFAWISDPTSYDLEKRVDGLADIVISTLKSGAIAR
jgi:TetR/AcrR family acrAB operon transcriptional repressor